MSKVFSSKTITSLFNATHKKVAATFIILCGLTSTSIGQFQNTNFKLSLSNENDIIVHSTTIGIIIMVIFAIFIIVGFGCILLSCLKENTKQTNPLVIIIVCCLPVFLNSCSTMSAWDDDYQRTGIQVKKEYLSVDPHECNDYLFDQMDFGSRIFTSVQCPKCGTIRR
jgi:hypothetical protein